jgi:hypothetical protein
MSPTIIAVIVGIVLQAITLGWGFVQSNKADRQEALVIACQAKHDAFVDQVEAQGEIAKAKARIKERQNVQIAEDTANGWAAAIERVRADYGQRLRDATRRGAGGGGVSAPAKDPSGHAEAGSDTVPSPERVASDCAETTITANFLQSYIERLQNE